MPATFGTQILDDHSPAPPHAAVVLLETEASTNYHRIIDDILTDQTVLYINPDTDPDTGLPARHTNQSDKLNATNTPTYPTFEALLDDLPADTTLTDVDTLLFENAESLDPFGSNLIKAAREFMDLLEDAYILCHAAPEETGDHDDIFAARTHSDLVAHVTTSLHGEHIQITDNQFGPTMDAPAALPTTAPTLETPHDDAPDTVERGDTFEFDVALGGSDQDLTTDTDTVTNDDSRLESSTQRETGTNGDDSLAALSTIDVPENSQPADQPQTPAESPVRDGVARGRALLDSYDIQSPMDVEDLKWQNLLELVSALDVDEHSADRDTYEAHLKDIIRDIQNGDHSVDTMDAYLAAISTPVDIKALEKEPLVYLAESLQVEPDERDREGYETAVIDELFEDHTHTQPPADHEDRDVASPFNLIDPDGEFNRR